MKFASSYEPGEYEADIYAGWEASGVFSPRDVREGEQGYSIVMPPPNANGNLHIGHGLTIAIEDALTRYHRLRGEATWYVPGADHAGFETWVVYERVLEKAGHTRFEYSRDDLYAQVWNFVQEQRGNMELQVRALGASCAWKDLTFTLDENVVRRVYDTFKKMWDDGMIYRGEKLVNFCTKHQTAFADIEVVHKDEPGVLYDIAYIVAEVGESDSSAAPHEIIVSTTRPETLFGDMAVAVNVEDERYRGMEGMRVKLPLTDREIPIIYDEHADPEYGTGAVKITPAHDYDDFEVGERHNLERLQVIGTDGTMLPVCGEKYAGMTTKECRKQVLKDLEEQGLLRGERKITHAVAHCYKCDTVIEPMLKEQWFIDTEKLAKTAIEHLEKDEIKFHPESKKKVLIDYLKGLKDWNISRQIPWGIAIPMFKRVDLNEDADGATQEKDAPDWIFDTRTNLQEIEIGGVRYQRDEDTFDTWFSSSHWPIVCTNWEEGMENAFYPLNVMETGADILFAWVARMIMMGLYVTGEVPFKEVYLHGLVLDEHGQKMSKSKGNVINPMDLVSKYGSDAFRLGILRGRSAGMNQAFSEQSVVAGRNLCNKLWNIARLVQDLVEEQNILSVAPDSSENAEGISLLAGDNQATEKDISAPSTSATTEKDISVSSTSVTTENMGEDWICREINEARWQVESQMKNYRFSEAVETMYDLIWNKYADWFIESQKIYKNTGLLKTTLEAILTMLHPFAPFVTETIWQSLSWTEGMVVTQKWPSDLKFDPISAENFERLMVAVSGVRSTLQALSEASKGKFKGDCALLYGDDAIIDDNQILVQRLARVNSVIPTDGQPRGLRLALANHELYLDVDAEVVKMYADALEKKILSVGEELNALNMRMMNPNYVDKAPAELVNETRKAIEEKEELIERLKKEREAI